MALCALLATISLVSAHNTDISSPEGIIAPLAPDLSTLSEQQTLYKIDTSQSYAQYHVQEKFIGFIDGKTVIGETSEISGDIVIDWNDLSQSRIGEFIVDMSQLQSDSKQRDRQVNKKYLETELYPTANFIPEIEQSLPSTVAVGETVSFTMHGFLTVHGVTVLSDWDVALTLQEDHLVGKATTDILMSDVGVGPINIVGFVSTEDQMQLSLSFVASSTEGDISARSTSEIQAYSQSIETEEQDRIISNNTSSTDFIFSKDIQSIFESKCVACHSQGEIGHSIFPMDTVADVVDFAEDIALVVDTGFMPPWSPSHLSPSFKADRSLKDVDLDALLEWVTAGTPTNVSLDTPLVDRSPVGTVLSEDIVLTMPEPYVPAGDMSDDYRCFLMDPQLPDGGFVTGSNVIPGDKRVVHHVILFQASVESQIEAEVRAQEDNRLGYECFGGPGLSTVESGAIGNSVGAWVPGSTAIIHGEGTGVYVPPNGLIVMQVHYNYEAGFYPDQTSAVLQVESVDSGTKALLGMPLLAPVEIPCLVSPESTTGHQNPNCDRATALANKPKNDQKLAYGLMRMCDKTLEDYAGQSATNATSSCDWQIPADGEIVQVTSHMHTLGSTTQLLLNPDKPNPTVLIDIPIWDFNWQGSYQLEQPINVKKGDIVRLTCAWDNSKNTNSEDARYITWGEGTYDEMCLNIISINPVKDYPAGQNIILASLNTFPAWMPYWLRTRMLSLQGSSNMFLLFGAIALGFVGIAFMFFRILKLKKPSVLETDTNQNI